MKKLMCGLIFLVTLPTYAANFFIKDVGNSCTLSGIQINGEILIGDAQKFKVEANNLFKKYGEKNCIGGQTMVILDSAGGDVDESILIGKEIRDKNLMTVVGENAVCHSSCVLIFSGGTYRVPIGEIGVHRPYLSSLSDGKLVVEIRKIREELNLRIKSFLTYVDVSSLLLDEMLSYPPEKMKILSTQELQKFRILGKDATQDELDTAANAYYYNISSAEYRRRGALIESRCAYLFKSNASGQINLQCVQSVYLNISEVEVEKRHKKIRSLCTNLTAKKYKSCSKYYLVEGK
jgi:hypothetical protein